MPNTKELPLIVSCLQLLALKEILQSPQFQSKNPGELQWLLNCIDKTVKIDDVARQAFGGIEEMLAQYEREYGPRK